MAESLVDTLRFYANRDNYKEERGLFSIVQSDQGAKARATLKMRDWQPLFDSLLELSQDDLALVVLSLPPDKISILRRMLRVD
ncbi:MAG: hypothetical protein KGL39_24420 [Patescibacteria group bacterium]|nr:hypothetical protein [Patescibacteria group bacterium]